MPRTVYTGIYTTVTDQAGKVRRSMTDGLGRLIEVHEPDGSGNLGTITIPTQKTSYLYDVLGNLTQVNQGSQQRLFTYDSLSRLRTAKNPEQVNGSGVMVATTYSYDDAGNLTSKTDPRGVVTQFVYDVLNRVTQRSYSDGTPAVSYEYDSATVANSKGRLTKVSSSVSVYEYQGYDALGRVLSGRQTTSGNVYTMSYGYDLAGNLTKQVYPSGREVITNYDSAGRLSSVAGTKDSVTTTYTSQYSYTPHGAALSFKLGNNLWEHMNFNARLQPTQIGLGTTSTTSGTLELNYTYGTSNNNGNVQTQEVKIGATTITQSYSYDTLNRLSIASESVSGVPKWTQNYVYDRFGNRTSLSNSGSEGGLLPTQSTPGINAATNRLVGFGYDNAGNVLSDGLGNTYTYDGDNKQKSHNNTSSGLTQYFYDGDGRRVKKQNGVNITIFVYNGFGQLIAEYADPLPPAQGGGGTSYLTTDHLGSTRVVTNSSGGVKSRRDYCPFGEEIGSGIGSRTAGMGYSQADGVRQKFTSKERDSESGLDYFLARYYSSAQGRFTSIDEPFADQDETDPQSWNLYTYVVNNPLKYDDPLGLWKRKKTEDGTLVYIAEKGDTLETLAKILHVSVKSLVGSLGGDEVQIGQEFDVTNYQDYQSDTFNRLVNIVSEDDVPPAEQWIVEVYPSAGGIRRFRIRPGGGLRAAAAGKLRQLGLEGVKLAGQSYSSGRKALEAAGFRLIRTTSSGRRIFQHPKTGAIVTYDSGKALGAGQKPHWTIQDRGGQFYDRSGREVTGPSSPMGGKHIPGR